MTFDIHKEGGRTAVSGSGIKGSSEGIHREIRSNESRLSGAASEIKVYGDDDDRGNNQHMIDIQKQAEERMDELMPELMKIAGATEELKAADQMKWVGLVNNCKQQAEEIIKEEIIYS